MAQGTFPSHQAERFIETGKLGPAQAERVEYSSEVMEILAKKLDRAYGG